MSHTAIIFEDMGWKRLYPITLSRPAFDCRIGVTTLGRRLTGQLGLNDHKRVGYQCRTTFRPLTEIETISPLSWEMPRTMIRFPSRRTDVTIVAGG